MALLGSSGGGKTTVLRMIAGLELPTEGDIFIRGERVNDIPVAKAQHRLRLPELRALQEHDGVQKHRLRPQNKKMETRSRKSKRASRNSWNCPASPDLEKRYPHSTLRRPAPARRHRARPGAQSPSVLLLDEPFGAVDAKIRQELREWLVTLHHDLNVTTLFVTHDQEEAMEVSDRIVIFSSGALSQIGTPREVYEQPANEFVARFIGVMNVLETKVQGGMGRVERTWEFPAAGRPEGERMRIGFRPYAVQISTDLAQYRYRAILRRTYFLGIMLRLEIELPSGLTLRSRMTKEEYAQLQLWDTREISFQIRQYRTLAREGTSLPPELQNHYEAPPTIAEHI